LSTGNPPAAGEAFKVVGGGVASTPPSGGSATNGEVVYVLRTYPEPSETFIRREIEGLVRVGIPVSIVAMERVATAAPPDESGSGGRAAVHFLRDAPESGSRAGPGPAALARLTGAVAGDIAHLRAHPRRTARCLRLAAYAIRGSRRISTGCRRLHAHFANDAAALARYLSVLTRVPYAITAHAYDIYQDPFLLKRNLASAMKVFTVSRSNVRHLRSTYDIEPEDRCSVLHCGIDLERFPYRDPEPPRRPARLLCVARLIPKKGHAVLIRAMQALRQDGVPARLVVAGEGPLDRSLRALVSELGLESSVEFLGGVPVDRVRALMLDSDVVVLASRVADDGDRDGLPVVLIEAASLGTPVVATDVSGIPELVTEENGWLTPPDRPDLLAAVLRSAIDEPHASRVDRARRARRTVEEQFDVAQQIETLRSL
jgi:glycosyltransferase involved in cell wall biosynthesis